MSETEAKTEGGPTDNTQKKKELEDKIAKASITGTEASLKCFEELKKINITLNQDESITDLPKIFKTVFPKFGDHTFKNIKVKIDASREMKEMKKMKGGEDKNYDTAWEEAKSDDGPGSVYVFKIDDVITKLTSGMPLGKKLQETGKQYLAVVVGEPFSLKVFDISDEYDNDEILKNSDLKKEITSSEDPADIETLEEVLNIWLEKTVTDEGIFNELQTDDFISPIIPEFHRWFVTALTDVTISNFTQDETGIVFKSGDKYYAYISDSSTMKSAGIKGVVAGVGAGAIVGLSTIATGGTFIAVAIAAGVVTGVGADYAVDAKQKSDEDRSLLGKFCEITGIQKIDGEDVPISDDIVKLLKTPAYKNCRLTGELRDAFKNQEEAQEILIDYQNAFLNRDTPLLPPRVSMGFVLIDQIVDIGLDSSVGQFSQKWKETKKAAIKRNPDMSEQIDKLYSLPSASAQGLINEITKTVTLQNKAGKGIAAVVGATGSLVSGSAPAFASVAGKGLLAAISSHAVLAGIVIAVAIAAKHFKPGEPEDYLSMYIGTELAPQLQIFERTQLTMKTGTTGDLGLTYTKFVTEVLAPKAKGYLTSSELISLITQESISTQDTIDNFKKFETEITLKGSSLNLDSILGQTIEGKIDAEIAKLGTQMKQIDTQIIDVDATQTGQKKQKALEQKKSEIEAEIEAKKAEKTKFVDQKETIEDDITNVLVKYLKGEYGSTQSKGGGSAEEDLIKALTDLLKSEEIAKKIKDHVSEIIKHRVKIAGVIEELKKINTQLEEVSPKELSAVEQVSKGTHPIIYAKFIKAFGPEKGDKMFSKVFSSTIKRTMGAEENLATLFDENRKADLERVLVDENTVARAKLQELCNSYKEAITKKDEKKKKEEEAKKAREDKLKGLAVNTSDDASGSGDIDLSGVSGLASSAYDKLSGLTDLMGKTGADIEGKTSDSLLDKAKIGLQLPDVKTGPDSYKPKDYKSGDLTTITKQELDDLREAEETLRKQLEMDRAIMKQYKQNIERDISEHYKVLKLKEEQLLQKGDHTIREQQKIVSYYMGVLQNREGILLEQEKILEMKRKKELEEIEQLRVSVQRGLVKELEKEKKHLLKHHNKQMGKQRSLLQEELKDYKGDNLHLRKLLRKYQGDVPDRRGSITHKKEKKGKQSKSTDTIVQKSFMQTFVY